MWTKAAGVDFGTCPALASFACRAPVVGEQFAPRSSRQASEPSELSLEHMHSHVFLTGCFKGSPELFDQVLQTLFRVLLLAALTVAFITGYSIWARTERASPHSASTERLLDRSLPWLSRVKQLEKCSPWWAKVILGHHSPGRQQGMCALLVRGQRQALVGLCWKAFVTVQGWQGGPLTEHLDSVAQHNSGAEEKPLQSSSCAECEGNTRAKGDPHCTSQGQHLSLPHSSPSTTDKSQLCLSEILSLFNSKVHPLSINLQKFLERKKGIMADQKEGGERTCMGNGVLLLVSSLLREVEWVTQAKNLTWFY